MDGYNITCIKSTQSVQLWASSPPWLGAYVTLYSDDCGPQVAVTARQRGLFIWNAGDCTDHRHVKRHDANRSLSCLIISKGDVERCWAPPGALFLCHERLWCNSLFTAFWMRTERLRATSALSEFVEESKISANWGGGMRQWRSPCRIHALIATLNNKGFLSKQKKNQTGNDTSLLYFSRSPFQHFWIYNVNKITDQMHYTQSGAQLGSHADAGQQGSIREKAFFLTTHESSQA